MESINQPELVAECRTLLRNFRNPERLRHNSLATAVFALAPKASERQFVVEEIIVSALARLDSRARSIIKRCDIDKEPFAGVAHDLGMSERHLYRERRRVLCELAHIMYLLCDDGAKSHAELTTALEDQLRISRVLEENGDRGAASSIIERLLLESPDKERYRLLLRLAEMHARAGEFARAQSYLELASENARGNGALDGVVAAELFIARAYAFEECGRDEVVAAKCANSAIDLMYANGTHRYDSNVAAILISALVLRGRSCASAGQLDELVRTSDEAAGVLELVPHPNEDCQMGVLFLTACCDVLCKSDLRAARFRLSQAASIARSAGFTLSSLLLLTNLASTYRLQEEPEKAIRALASVLPIARDLGNKNVLLAVLVDLASSHTDSGQYEKAQSFLVEASRLNAENEALQGSLLRTSSKVNLASRSFSCALDEARMAESRFAALGKTRLLGTPLRVQAEALLGLGERRAALRAALGAIAVLSETNTEVALGQAYGVLHKITGRHYRVPRLLRRSDR